MPSRAFGGVETKGATSLFFAKRGTGPGQIASVDDAPEAAAALDDRQLRSAKAGRKGAKLGLRPFLRFVVVALGALDLRAEEDARRLTGEVLGRVAKLRGEVHGGSDALDLEALGRFRERRRAEEARRAATGRCDERRRELVPLGVPREGLAEPRAEGQSVDVAGPRTADEDLFPAGGPVVGVVLRREQLVDDASALVRCLVGEERRDAVGRGNDADDVEVNATKERGVVGARRRRDAAALPFATKERIEGGRREGRRRGRRCRGLVGHRLGRAGRAAATEDRGESRGDADGGRPQRETSDAGCELRPGFLPRCEGSAHEREVTFEAKGGRGLHETSRTAASRRSRGIVRVTWRGRRTMRVVASTGSEIARFIRKYSPAIAAQIRGARAKLHELFPTGYELVYDNYNALVFAFAPTLRASDIVLSIAAYPRWVTLFFLHGKTLADPKGRLQGTGSQIRSVVLSAPADLDTPAVRALIRQAQKPAAAALKKAPARTTIIKSVSLKQRPRRAAAAEAKTARSPKRAAPRKRA